MHTRVVDLTSKPEKARELCRTIEDQVLPILKKEHGVIDELVMVLTVTRIARCARVFAFLLSG